MFTIDYLNIINPFKFRNYPVIAQIVTTVYLLQWDASQINIIFIYVYLYEPRYKMRNDNC